VNTTSIPTLMKMVASGRLPAEKMGTHKFKFSEFDQAYEVFSNAATNKAIKVILEPV
jgi:alcohol dehydrogenase